MFLSSIILSSPTRRLSRQPTAIAATAFSTALAVHHHRLLSTTFTRTRSSGSGSGRSGRRASSISFRRQRAKILSSEYEYSRLLLPPFSALLRCYSSSSSCWQQQQQKQCGFVSSRNNGSIRRTGHRPGAVVAGTPWGHHQHSTTTQTKPTTSIRCMGSSNNNNNFFSDLDDFKSLGIQSEVLLKRMEKLLPQLQIPTTVQYAAYTDILENNTSVIVGAETGSGKTLAYLLPLMDDILQRKEKVAAGDSNGDNTLGYDYSRALILVPNKELVQQVVRMALPLAGGKESIVFGGSALQGMQFPNDREIQIMDDDDDNNNNIIRIGIMPGGLKTPMGFAPFRRAISEGSQQPVDLVIATPAAVGPLGLKPKHIDMFADIDTLVVDEADMLLDGGYTRPLENVFMGFKRADRLDPAYGVPKTQYVFVAATIPNFGMRSVDKYLKKKFPQAKHLTMDGMHNARHSGLSEGTLWLQVESKKDRMQQLVDMLRDDGDDDKNGLKDEKVMVFLNTVEDVERAAAALTRAGFSVVTYHASIPLEERAQLLDRFRKYRKGAKNDKEAVPILVCTDLASRGLDIPDVTVIVQLQFAGNVVGHLHRMGRCGRAGQQTGRGIVFYEEMQQELVQVVQQAEEEQERMVLPGADVLDLDEEEDMEEDEDEAKAKKQGTVEKAFSRNRSFRHKLKRRQKRAAEKLAAEKLNAE